MIDCRSKISETIYVFDLLETEIFMDTKRKKRVAEGTILPETVNQEEQALSDKEKAAIADEEKAIKKRNRMKKETRKEGSDDVSIRKPEYRI